MDIMKTIRYAMNAGNEERFLERYFGVSATIPDQALTVQEIMRRYARGLSVEGRNPVYNEDVDFDFDRLDLSEKAELIEQNKARIEQMQSSLRRAKAHPANGDDGGISAPSSTVADRKATPSDGIETGEAPKVSTNVP